MANDPAIPPANALCAWSGESAGRSRAERLLERRQVLLDHVVGPSVLLIAPAQAPELQLGPELAPAGLRPVEFRDRFLLRLREVVVDPEHVDGEVAGPGPRLERLMVLVHRR